MFKYPGTEILRELGKIQQSAPVKSAAQTTGTFIRNVTGYAAAPVGLGLGAGVGVWGISQGISEGAEALTQKEKNDSKYTGALKLVLTALFIFFVYKRYIKR